MIIPSRMHIKQRGIHQIGIHLRINWGVWEMRLRRLTSKNGCHERSFTFALQSNFKLKKIDFEKKGPYRVHFIRRDSPYGVHFIRRDSPYGVHFIRRDSPYGVLFICRDSPYG